MGQRIAWNVEGPVLAFYQDRLIYAIESTFETYKKKILRGTNWDRSVDCWMIGTDVSDAAPHIVISCMDLSIVTRFMNKLKKDEVIRASGFTVVGRKSRLWLTGGRFDSGSKTNSSSLVNTDFSGMQISIKPMVDSSPSKLGTAVLGGVVVLESQEPDEAIDGLYVLTAAHPFLKSNAAAGDQEDVEHDLISWNDIDSDEDCSEDGSTGSSVSSNEVGSQMENIDLGHDRQFAFQPAYAVLRESENAQDQVEFGSTTVATFGLPEESLPRASLVGDWALLSPTVEPCNILNEVVHKGRRLAVSDLTGITDNMDVLCVQSKSGELERYRCSGSTSLITIAGQESFQRAHRIYGHFGEYFSFHIRMSWYRPRRIMRMSMRQRSVRAGLDECSQ